MTTLADTGPILLDELMQRAAALKLHGLVAHPLCQDSCRL